MTRFAPLMLLLLVLTGNVLAEEFRLGVWNIEKLSRQSLRGFPERPDDKQFHPRTNSDLEKIAEYIEEELKVDGLIVTEIEADDGTVARPESKQLSRIVSEMGNEWQYFLGRTGGDLRIGFVFNSKRIQVHRIANLNASEFKIRDKDVYDRDPLILHIELKAGGEPNRKLLLVGLHLKSQQFRVHNHMAAIAKLLGDLESEEVMEDLRLPDPDNNDDVVILGDLNNSTFDEPNRYIFNYLEGEGYTHLGPEGSAYPHTRVNGSKIDHIFVSKSLMSAVDEEKFRAFTVPSADRDAYREVFSDHFPVTFAIDGE